jgi:hypothetical protein
MPVSFGLIGARAPLPPLPTLLRAPVVVEASSVVVVDGSSTIVGPGRAVVVLDDLPTMRPFSVREPEEQAPVRRARVARPATPVLRKADELRMGSGRPFQNGAKGSDRLTHRELGALG